MQEIEREKYEQQYKSRIEAQLAFFVHKRLLGPIADYQTIRNWIQQFPEGSLTPYFLLDALVILTREQVEASLRNIVEQIKASIYVKNPDFDDEKLYAEYEKHLSSSLFVCACAPDEMAGGAPETMRILRSIIGGMFKEASIPDLCETIRIKKIKNVYIIDDFIGTGETIAKQLKKQHLSEKCPNEASIAKCSLQCVAANNPDVSLTIVSVVAHLKGKERLENEFPEFKQMSAYSIDDDYDLLSEGCALYRDSLYMKQTIEDIRKIINDYKMGDNPFALNLPLGISGEFPNNSLELFWWNESDSWKPLAPRNH